MAKAQWPIDGKFGSTFKVTSPFGWRMHPVRKVKAHHNGVDLWGPAETIYIESMFDGTVIFAGPSKTKNSDGSVGGFGYHVQVRFQFRGEWYVATFAHMKQGSIKVKKGQKIEAGTVLGIMGATGMVNGRHLHLELTKGKNYKWTSNGVGFLDPIEFIKAAIRFERITATAKLATSEAAPVAPEPVHGDTPAPAPTPAPVAAPKPATPAAAPAAKKQVPAYTVKSGDSYWAIAEKYVGKYGDGASVGEYTKTLQKLNKNKGLNPGDKVRLK